MPINETFYGFIENTTDALLIFEACRRGILSKITRRLQEKERSIIRSGSVFVFDEKESGIKRWTDGRVWSPSRILGNFLIYRELDGRETLHQRQQYDNHDYYMQSKYDSPYRDDKEKNRERNLIGSLTDTYKFLQNGLIKKTISLQIDGRTQHLVSYYSKSDVISAKLPTPSSLSNIASLDISPELIMNQSFRVPPSVEFAESILKGPSPSNSSTTSKSLKRRLSDINLSQSPKYSIYDDQPYSSSNFNSSRLYNSPNNYNIPPLSMVTDSIPYYHQGKNNPENRIPPKYHSYHSSESPNINNDSLHGNSVPSSNILSPPYYVYDNRNYSTSLPTQQKLNPPIEQDNSFGKLARPYSKAEPTSLFNQKDSFQRYSTPSLPSPASLIYQLNRDQQNQLSSSSSSSSIHQYSLSNNEPSTSDSVMNRNDHKFSSY